MDEPRETVIDAELPSPMRKGLRYELSPYTLGQLEKIGHAKFEIGRLTADDFLAPWNADAAALWNIAQSVNASSEIEGEEIPASKLELALAAATKPAARRMDEELERRMAAIASIIRTLLWALFEPPPEFMSFGFVLEVHRRMFESTESGMAGRLKTKRVAIEGGPYNIRTLPPEKTEAFLRALCDRTNDALVAEERSRFLTIAEFILDFLAIHPFHDGNGRTARLLSTYLLERCGYHFARFYPVDNVILERRAEYYDALFRAQRQWYQAGEDLTPWIEFYTDVVFSQYSRALQRVRDASARGRE
jgi:Fic family protein